MTSAGVAGFARYIPWDSVRVAVTEDELRPDNRILAYLFNPAVRLHITPRTAYLFFMFVAHDQAAIWLHGISGRQQYAGPKSTRDAAARAAATHLGVALSNRSPEPFNFTVVLEGIPANAPAPVFDGHEYGPNVTDVSLGSVSATLDSYGHWALKLSLSPLVIQASWLWRCYFTLTQASTLRNIPIHWQFWTQSA